MNDILAADERRVLAESVARFKSDVASFIGSQLIAMEDRLLWLRGWNADRQRAELTMNGRTEELSVLSLQKESADDQLSRIKQRNLALAQELDQLKHLSSELEAQVTRTVHSHVGKILDKIELGSLRGEAPVAASLEKSDVVSYRVYPVYTSVPIPQANQVGAKQIGAPVIHSSSSQPPVSMKVMPLVPGTEEAVRVLVISLEGKVDKYSAELKRLLQERAELEAERVASVTSVTEEGDVLASVAVGQLDELVSTSRATLRTLKSSANSLVEAYRAVDRKWRQYDESHANWQAEAKGRAARAVRREGSRDTPAVLERNLSADHSALDDMLAQTSATDQSKLEGHLASKQRIQTLRKELNTEKLASKSEIESLESEILSTKAKVKRCQCAARNKTEGIANDLHRLRVQVNKLVSNMRKYDIYDRTLVTEVNGINADITAAYHQFTNAVNREATSDHE